MTTNLKLMFVGFGAYMGMDLAFDEPRCFPAKLGEERVKVVFSALCLQHHGAIGLVAYPPRDWELHRGVPSSDTKPHALNSALEDYALTGDHAEIVDGDRTRVGDWDRLCGFALIFISQWRCRACWRVHLGVSGERAHR